MGDQALFEKYPALKKLEELGDDYVECGDGREEALLAFVKEHPRFDQVKGNPPLLLQLMDDFAANHDFLINIGSDKGRILEKLLETEKPQRLVELGGYVGYSAILFAHKMQAQQPKTHIWSLEYEPRYAKIMEEFVAIAGLQSAITVVVGSADESLRKLTQSGQLDSVDLLFLDHEESLYKKDLKVALDEVKILKPGALIVADNVVRPGAPDYVKYVRGRAGLESKGIPGLIMPGEFEDELEVTRVV